ncbi:hypothetical protein WISP_90556 [Willisornis vidua]|uniref:Uncharacterized protein n=1 Tax=Willisornis vidua TaxID=1566151 RepID=A0ABQ9D7H7_9PASS|nr:hypothetical protein WISP_90556 [Willisornis vidua]
MTSCQKRPLCLMETVPAGCKTDHQWPRLSQRVSNSGSTSGITSSRRRGGKPVQQQQQPKRGVRIHERKSSADTKAVKEGQVVLQRTRSSSEAEIHLQPMENLTPEQVDASKGVCDPMESPHWSRLLAGLVAPWREEPKLEQVWWWDL